LRERRAFRFEPFLKFMHHVLKFLGAERLGQKGTRSKGIGTLGQFDFTAGGENDHRDAVVGRMILQPLKDIESIHARHPQIKQHQDWSRRLGSAGKPFLTLEIGDQLLAGMQGGGGKLRADSGQQLLHESHIIQIIINY